MQFSQWRWLQFNRFEINSSPFFRFQLKQCNADDDILPHRKLCGRCNLCKSLNFNLWYWLKMQMASLKTLLQLMLKLLSCQLLNFTQSRHKSWFDYVSKWFRIEYGSSFVVHCFFFVFSCQSIAFEYANQWNFISFFFTTAIAVSH